MSERKKIKCVACGGTFDLLHKGHKTLLKKAFEVGEQVFIGLCTDEFVKTLKKNHEVSPYGERLAELVRFLIEEDLIERAEIVSLEDPHGPAAWDESVDAIIVSEETKAETEKINEFRVKNGLKPLEVICIPMVLAEDGLPISSTRIRIGEIDREGRLLRQVECKQT